MIKSESIAKLSAALLAAQKEMGDAVKDSKNPFFKSSYADLNSIREAVTPALHRNGVVVLQLPMVLDLQHGPKSVVRTTLLHESGEYISSDTEIVCSKSNDPQAYGSAVSYARRFGLAATCSVGTTDDDGESAMTRAASTTAKSVGSTTPAISNGKEGFGSFRKGPPVNG